MHGETLKFVCYSFSSQKSCFRRYECSQSIRKEDSKTN